MQLQAISLRRWLICISENIEHLDMIVGLELCGRRVKKSFREIKVLKRDFALILITEVMRSAAARLHCNSTIFSTVNAVCSPVTWPGDGSELAEEMPVLSIPGFIRRPHRKAAIESGLTFEAGEGFDAVGSVTASDVVDVAG